LHREDHEEDSDDERDDDECQALDDGERAVDRGDSGEAIDRGCAIECLHALDCAVDARCHRGRVERRLGVGEHQGGRNGDRVGVLDTCRHLEGGVRDEDRGLDAEASLLRQPDDADRVASIGSDDGDRVADGQSPVGVDVTGDSLAVATRKTPLHKSCWPSRSVERVSEEHDIELVAIRARGHRVDAERTGSGDPCDRADGVHGRRRKDRALGVPPGIFAVDHDLARLGCERTREEGEQRRQQRRLEQDEEDEQAHCANQEREPEAGARDLTEGQMHGVGNRPTAGTMP
jgi:hypothetical protein